MWAPEPDWLWEWRYALGVRRLEIIERRDERDQCRVDAGAQLDALAPALAAAKSAWQPYQARIDDLERRLESQLRPPMYKAHHDRHSAGFGHRNRAERAARRATADVRAVEACVQTIRDDGQAVKARLDDVASRTGQLRQLAAPPSAWTSEDQLLSRLDQLTNAIDTWNDWNTGQPTNTNALVDALDVLNEQASRAPAYVWSAGEITSSQLDDVTGPLADWLVERGIIQPVPAAEHRLERDIGLGIDL